MSDQLGAVLPVALLVAGTVPGELVGDVTAQLVPDARGARRGEGPQLKRRATQRQDDGGDGAVGRLLQAQLHPVDGRDLQRAQVDAGHLLLVLGQLAEVPGSGGGGLVEGVVAEVAPEDGLVRIGGCVVTTAREQSHGDLLSWVGASAGAVGAHRKTGRLVDEGQLAAVMDEEALRAGELVLELGHDVNAQLLPGQVRPGKLEALGGLVLGLLDRSG